MTNYQPPRAPGQAAQRASRTGWVGAASGTGRVTGAAPVRPRAKARRVAAAAAAVSPVELIGSCTAVMTEWHTVDYVQIGPLIEVPRDRISLPALHVMDPVPWEGQETWHGTACTFHDDQDRYWIVTVFPVVTPS